MCQRYKLIRAGADANLIEDARGSTALMRAASDPHSCDDCNDSILLYQSNIATIFFAGRHFFSVTVGQRSRIENQTKIFLDKGDLLIR